MNCQEHFEALSAYVDGDLPPGEVVLIEVHLPQCQGCDSQLKSMRALKNAISKLLAGDELEDVVIDDVLVEEPRPPGLFVANTFYIRYLMNRLGDGTGVTLERLG